MLLVIDILLLVSLTPFLVKYLSLLIISCKDLVLPLLALTSIGIISPTFVIKKN